jgi:hypothetical protein
MMTEIVTCSTDEFLNLVGVKIHKTSMQKRMRIRAALAQLVLRAKHVWLFYPSCS